MLLKQVVHHQRCEFEAEPVTSSLPYLVAIVFADERMHLASQAMSHAPSHRAP